jgi:hypothetical protein
MTPADLIQIGRDMNPEWNSQEGQSFLAVFGTDLSGDSLGTMVVEKNDARRERFFNRSATNREPEQYVERICSDEEIGCECMNLPFDMKKLALITMKGHGLSIAFDNPKKAMSIRPASFEEASSNLDPAMVFPRRGKDLFCP